jgi:hypothetical protein
MKATPISTVASDAKGNHERTLDRLHAPRLGTPFGHTAGHWMRFSLGLFRKPKGKQAEATVFLTVPLRKRCRPFDSRWHPTIGTCVYGRTHRFDATENKGPFSRALSPEHAIQSLSSLRDCFQRGVM